MDIFWRKFQKLGLSASIKAENGLLAWRKMETGDVFAAISMLGLFSLFGSLSPSALAVENTDIRSAQLSAATPHGDHAAVEKYYEEEAMKRHDVIAKYYEDEAGKMQAKAKELKLLLEHYEEKSYLYGKKAQDLQAHTEALVRKYEKAARTDAAEAASHRQIASKLKEKSYAAARSQRLSAINRSHRDRVSPE